MTPLRPYMLRAVNEWAIDNGYTPHVLVDATKEGVRVPKEFIQDGRITLNIHPNAIRQLELGNEWVMFDTRFGGQSFAVEIPVVAIQAVFAKESGKGVFFQEEPMDDPLPPEPGPVTTKTTDKKGPKLKVVK